jgi:hypothetical protein
MQFDYYTTTVILSRSRSSVANDLPLNGTSAHDKSMDSPSAESIEPRQQSSFRVPPGKCAPRSTRKSTLTS